MPKDGQNWVITSWCKQEGEGHDCYVHKMNLSLAPDSKHTEIAKSTAI
jgi:hypothetical protein